jgi:hypothetical protein
MFPSAFRLSVNIFSRRLFSQSSVLPYKIDRFNAARVRIEDWPDDINIIKEQLSGHYSIFVT